MRAEVYALGATLAEGMARRGSALDFETRIALTKIAARATETPPEARYPSVDELASALRSAAGLRATPFREDAAWPVLGLEATSGRLASAVAAMAPGEALAVEGARGSGRTTLVRRLAWTLGVEGRAVVNVEAPRGEMSPREAVEMQIAAHEKGAALILVVDDLAALDEAAKEVLSRASEGGAKLIVVGAENDVRPMAKGRTRAFVVPPLDARSAEELVRRAVPSLPDAIRPHLVERVEGRPGTLRAFLKKARGRPIVSAEDIDAVFATTSGSLAPSSKNRAQALAAIEAALDRGRFDEATAQMESFGAPLDAEERVRLAVGEARVVLARAETQRAAKLLDGVASEAKTSRLARAWTAVRARTHLRAGEYAEALVLAEVAIGNGEHDAIASDALSVRGLALSFTSQDAGALASIEQATAVARAVGDKRAEGVALGSLAIVHQRAGRATEAKRAYEESLAAAEAAGDAWVYAATRLNLAGLAQSEGDFAAALAHLEAAVDMGRRMGGGSAVQQALLNLANLDLYLGRFARASASIEQLAGDRAQLGANARAQLLGLEAELAMRAAEFGKGARLYENCAAACEAQGRPMDAAEARLEGILGRARDPMADLGQLARELDGLRKRAGDAGFREHEALAEIARGTIALLSGDESTARAALDEALAHATRAAQREWAWRALDARARLSASQGSIATARRDTEQALAMLEETASKLPRDLREVFWDDPRRRALRQAHTATIPMPLSSVPSAAFPGGLTSGAFPTRAAPTRPAPSGTTSIGAPLPAEDRLARIFEITRELASEHDMARLLERVTDHAIALLGAERGFVVLSNADGELEARAARSRKGGRAARAVLALGGGAGRADGGAGDRGAARDDERLAKAVSVHQLMIQSIACVPIRGAPPAGRTIGALYVETRLRPGHRFEAELPTLAAFADQAAIAIENARLLEENLARAEELARANIELAAARDKLAGSLEPEDRAARDGAARSEAGPRRAAESLRVRGSRRDERGDAQALRADRSREGHRRAGARHRRERHREGDGRARGARCTRRAARSRSSASTAARSRRTSSRASCSATSAARSPARTATGRGSSARPTGGRSCSTRSARCRSRCRRASSARCRRGRCARSAGRRKSRSTCASSRRRTAISRRWSARGRSARICSIASTSSKLRIPPLRERTDDIPALIDHFLTLFSVALPARPKDDRARSAPPARGLRLAGERAPARARAPERLADVRGERDHGERSDDPRLARGVVGRSRAICTPPELGVERDGDQAARVAVDAAADGVAVSDHRARQDSARADEL